MTLEQVVYFYIDLMCYRVVIRDREIKFWLSEGFQEIASKIISWQ